MADELDLGGWPEDTTLDLDDEVVVLAEVLQVVQTGPQGPPGAKGDPGNSGDASGSYVHEQLLAATVWIVDYSEHLGYDPAGIVVIDDEGYVRDGWSVQYLGAGRLRLAFDVAIAGIARLS